MDFETQYSPEQEREREEFRRDVRAWLKDNLEDVGAPPDAGDLTYEQFQRNRASLPGAVWRLGTEEQKRRVLPPILRGETITWELHTEPDAGSDLPSLKSTAVRQGDEYVITGTKAFAGGHFEAEYLFFLAITDPKAPRRQNLSVFLVPFGLPGITMTDHDMIAGSRKRTIIFQDVRAPASSLIGNEGDGWTGFTVGLMGAPSVGIGPNLEPGGHVRSHLPR